MSPSRTRLLVILVLLLVALVVGVFFATAWFAARAAAVSTVINEPAPGTGLADLSWYDRLGGPGPNDIGVAVASPPQFVTPFELVFPLVLTNTANQQIDPLAVQVTLQLSARGWILVGIVPAN
ncbi:MAG: hypothetical protein P4L93_03310 [Coriobacteriia bacterium]|nr:hypothetical protein [Coriobacteriia bacterium]